MARAVRYARKIGLVVVAFLVGWTGAASFWTITSDETSRLLFCLALWVVVTSVLVLMLFRRNE